jgi:acetyl-CoA carboxylase carboxyl transferase subunit alpha
MLRNLKISISQNLEGFKSMSPEEIYNDRKNKFLKIGRGKGFTTNLDNLSTSRLDKNFNQILKSKKTLIITLGVSVILLSSLIYFL